MVVKASPQTRAVFLCVTQGGGEKVERVKTGKGGGQYTGGAASALLVPGTGEK